MHQPFMSWPRVVVLPGVGEQVHVKFSQSVQDEWRGLQQSQSAEGAVAAWRSNFSDIWGNRDHWDGTADLESWVEQEVVRCSDAVWDTGESGGQLGALHHHYSGQRQTGSFRL